VILTHNQRQQLLDWINLVRKAAADPEKAIYDCRAMACAETMEDCEATDG
jgi:hypothetical protein